MNVPSSQDRSQCPICHAGVTADSLFCAGCGARLDEISTQELRGVIYLLSELKTWEAQRLIAVEEAEALRRRYELRRDELRAQLASNGDQSKSSAPLPLADEASTASAQGVAASSRHSRLAVASQRVRAAATQSEARRTLFETLTDPHTLRLLLYTGAAMLVVGIVIWLRDALYLKLQEPLVQAALLALGTVAVTILGWVTTLRTRLRMTGRALTLTGSLLVPVNFWFLVRSGLISNDGRAWLVCALCALLYAHTAAILRERLYVYLACAAIVATMWALIFRATPEAYGLYALALMTASLVFLHLARTFPLSPQRDEKTAATADAKAATADDEGARLSRWSYELWGPPLVRVALFGATISALCYMLLRLGPAPSLSAGFFRWRASDYDAGIGMLLFVAIAYISWFTARYIYTDRRGLLYTVSALALFWTELLLLDGLRVRGTAYLLAFSLTAAGASAISRFILKDVSLRPLHRATDIVFTLLLLTASFVALLIYLTTDEAQAWRPSILFTLVATILYGAARGWRERSTYGSGLASLAAIILVATGLDALRAVGLFPPSWPVAGFVIGAAFLLQQFCVRWLQPEEKAAVSVQHTRAPVIVAGTPAAIVCFVTDGAVIVCALLWLADTLSFMYESGWSGVCVLLLAWFYWTLRAARQRLALFVHLANVCAGASLLALLVALRCEARWVAVVFTLILLPLLFALGRYARAREAGWLATPASHDAAVLTALISLAVILQAAPVLQTGHELLLAPAVTAGALCAVTLLASLFSTGRERARYFRVGLCAAVAAFVLAILRAGFDPVIDVEMYTTPVAVLLLIVSYLAMRGEWDEYARDTSLLLWTGSLLLCGPLLIRALQFRLLLDLPAPWRDLGVLCVSLVLVLFGAMGRLRTPVIFGTITLLLELVALALTSVHWLQVPLKVYLTTTGVLIIIVWGVFEYRREQLLQLRQRLHERSAQARERFGEWR